MNIGIDLGGSHIGVGLVDLNGKIVAKKDTDIRLLYTSPSPRDRQKSRMPSSA